VLSVNPPTQSSGTPHFTRLPPNPICAARRLSLYLPTLLEGRLAAAQPIPTYPPRFSRYKNVTTKLRSIAEAYVCGMEEPRGPPLRHPPGLIVRPHPGPSAGEVRPHPTGA